MASAIGRPIQVERMTATRRRITYALICIEVNAEIDPLFELNVQYRNPVTGGDESVKVKVEYQWTPGRCTKCLVFGHDCNKPNTLIVPKPETKAKGTNQNAWMTRKKGKDKIDVNQTCSGTDISCIPSTSIGYRDEVMEMEHNAELQQIPSNITKLGEVVPEPIIKNTMLNVSVIDSTQITNNQDSVGNRKSNSTTIVSTINPKVTTLNMMQQNHHLSTNPFQALESMVTDPEGEEEHKNGANSNDSTVEVGKDPVTTSGRQEISGQPLKSTKNSSSSGMKPNTQSVSL